MLSLPAQQEIEVARQNLNSEFVLLVDCSLRMPFGSGAIEQRAAYFRVALSHFLLLSLLAVDRSQRGAALK